MNVKTILDTLETPAIASRLSRMRSRLINEEEKSKILNSFFSASSVVSSHGPSAAAKEHEKRILESILPPDLRWTPPYKIDDYKGNDMESDSSG